MKKFNLPEIQFNKDVAYQIAKRFFLITRLSLSIQLSKESVLIQLTSVSMLTVLSLLNIAFGYGRRFNSVSLIICILYYLFNYLTFKGGERE